MRRFQPVQPQDNRGKTDAPSVREFVDLNNEISRTLKPVTDCPWVDGILHENISASSGVEYALPHGLNRTYRGFFAVRNSSGATLDENYNSADRDQFVRFTPSANCTLSVVVF
jgi:hypothetical protein